MNCKIQGKLLGNFKSIVTPRVLTCLHSQLMNIQSSMYSSKTFLKKENPDEINDMPVIQYASENSKQKKRIYTWGNASFGCLGNPNFVKPPSGKKIVKQVNRPYKIPFSATHKIKDVACGCNFTVFLLSDPNNYFQVFGTGLNSDSQIGFHEVRRGHSLILLASPVPIQVPLHDKKTEVLQVACGRAHTIVLTDEGVFSLGNNSYGQCGRPIVEGEIYGGSNLIHKVTGIDGKVSLVECGQDHTVFLTEKGGVYTCGWGADGQTGQGNFENQGVPQKVIGDIEGEKIIEVSGSADCILALSDKGEVFGWGNSEYGQLHFGSNKSQYNVSRHLTLPNIGKVKSLSAGGTMCGIVSDKGQVYVWGYGILGQGPNVDHLSKPTLLPEPLFGKNELNPDVLVDSVTCGLNQYAAITNQGDLYVWGRNRNNILGLKHENDQFFPFRVCVPAKVKKLSFGTEHAAAFCESFS